MSRPPALAWCGVPLERHLCGVGEAAVLLYNREWGRAARLLRDCCGLEAGLEWLYVTAALHDVGKAAYAERAANRCRRGWAPSFRLHELVSGTALALASQAAGSRDLAWLLRLAALTGLMHHHGMGKPYPTVQSYAAEYRRSRPTGTGLAEAARAALEWLASRAPLFLPHGLGRGIREAARNASRTTGLTDPAAALTEAVHAVRRRGPLVTAYTVAVAATAAADTLIAQLERNDWNTDVLEENRWINRLLTEKTRPGKLREGLEAVRRKCGYTVEA